MDRIHEKAKNFLRGYMRSGGCGLQAQEEVGSSDGGGYAWQEGKGEALKEGLLLREAKSMEMIFKENRSGLNHLTPYRMPVKPKRFFGRSQGTTFVVITLNQ